jgi:DoxX-like family
MKKENLIFWITTGLFALFQGVMPALTGQTEMAKEGMMHLGYPAYFGLMLVVFKVAGCLALVVPQVPTRLKEWAYGCFFIELIAAMWSLIAVDGLTAGAFFPVVFMVVLGVSYAYYQKLK